MFVVVLTVEFAPYLKLLRKQSEEQANEHKDFREIAERMISDLHKDMIDSILICVCPNHLEWNEVPLPKKDRHNLRKRLATQCDYHEFESFEAFMKAYYNFMRTLEVKLSELNRDIDSIKTHHFEQHNNALYLYCNK
jgi:hypothetical protein